MTAWMSEAHLLDHFEIHGRKMGFRTAEEYDASAQATLETGTYFTYFDDGAGEERLGCFDRLTGLFVALTEDSEEIVTHFATTVQYIRRLPYNNYEE